MVVSAPHLDTRVGGTCLKKRQATDAAVAGLCMAVAIPRRATGWRAKAHQLADGEGLIDFRREAPWARTANMYLDKDGQRITGARQQRPWRRGVPGSVAGWNTRWEVGTMKRGQIIAPSSRCEEKGFALDPGRKSTCCARRREAFQGRCPPGERSTEQRPSPSTGRAPACKRTWRIRCAKSQARRRRFLQGQGGAAMVRRPSRGQGHPAQADLDQYKAAGCWRRWECDYRGFHIVFRAAPGSGWCRDGEILT